MRSKEGIGLDAHAGAASRLEQLDFDHTIHILR